MLAPSLLDDSPQLLLPPQSESEAQPRRSDEIPVLRRLAAAGRGAHDGKRDRRGGRVGHGARGGDVGDYAGGGHRRGDCVRGLSLYEGRFLVA